MITWARVAKNTVGRDFVVGDIHGEFDKVDQLLLKAKFDDEVDRLFATGDLIDRGDQNEDVVKWLEKPWFFSILGNHEQMLLEACESEGPRAKDMAGMHYANGGAWFYKLDADKQQGIYDALRPLPVAMEVECEIGNVGFIHADVPGFEWKTVRKNLQDNERSIQVALWGRDRIRRKITQPVNGIAKIFVGHSPVKYSHMLGNVHFVDTGACFKDGHMTMVEINTGETWTVK